MLSFTPEHNAEAEERLTVNKTKQEYILKYHRRAFILISTEDRNQLQRISWITLKSGKALLYDVAEN